MRAILVLSVACALGCGLPKVALGASVSIGARGSDAAEQRTVRSALWLAMVYAPGARDDDRSAYARERGAFDDEAPPCAIEIACAWERQAAYETSWGRSADILHDPESESW